jgi:Tfp pilus assembly protein PilX
VPTIATGDDYLAVIALIVNLVMCVLVVFLALTAVWSRSPARRRAAASMLDRLLRFLRHRS